MSTRADLDAFVPEKDFLVGIDSDGCVFDTMEIKWKECFIPRAIEHIGLQPVSKYARQCLEFANLYSQSRGANRFFGLLIALDWLEQMPAVAARGFTVPRLAAVREWAKTSSQPTPSLLRKTIASCDDRNARAELEATLAWSDSVNADIARLVHGVPPFPRVAEVLRALGERADILIVSSANGDALAREWEENGLTAHTRLICGQEAGSKAEVLAIAGASYPRDKVLMIGDAPGDASAARCNDARFYPILPGREEASWQRFADEAMARFFEGTYSGAYENGLFAAFSADLPERPSFLGT